MHAGVLHLRLTTDLVHLGQSSSELVLPEYPTGVEVSRTPVNLRHNSSRSKSCDETSSRDI